jgi:maltose O-acetyltransferase
MIYPISSRTEKEKMLAQEMYTFFDPELEEERRQNKTLLCRYNLLQDDTERHSLLPQLVGQAGLHTIVETPFFCTYGKNIYLGDFVFLNTLCTFIDNNKIIIGNHVMIGPNVQIYTAAHPLRAEIRNQGYEIAKPVTVEDNVWIGGGAILLPGVTIGHDVVIGAGSVVTRSVPSYKVVAGNPARTIREIDKD